MMPLLKAFCCVGNSRLRLTSKELVFLIIGIMGALILLFGLTQNPAQIYFVIGAALLLATAFYYKLIYFIALEIILLAGHGAILLGIGPILQFALPVLLCLQLFVFFFLTNQLNNIFLFIGISGIALLSIGFSYQNQWIFFVGSTAVSVYSFSTALRGQFIGLLWGMLNALFALFAIFKLIAISF